MSGTSLTVAVPTCNGERHLREALRSILGQSDAEFELLVSDDRSEDHTLEIVRAEAGDRAKVVVNSERVGLAGNWNQCVALSASPLVAVFHQDDVMRPGHLAAQLAAFRADDRLGLVCSAAEAIDDAGQPIPPSTISPGGLGPEDRRFGPGAVLSQLAVGNPLRCSGVTLRKEAHGDVGGFDASYRYVVDWDFWIRVGRRWGVRWLARPTVEFRWHAASETHRFKVATLDLDETQRLLEELFLHDDIRSPDSARLRRHAYRKLARAYLNRAHDAVRVGDADLMRSCVRRAITLNPLTIARLALDPRLAAQLAVMGAAPRTASRWLARRATRSVP